MLNLSATTQKLQVVLAAAKTTNDCPVTVSYFNGLTGTARSSFGDQCYTAQTITNGVTAVDILAAPSASTMNRLETLTVFNADTVPTTVSVQMVSAGPNSPYILEQVVLQPNESLCYDGNSGFYCNRNVIPTGRIVTLQTAGTAFSSFTTAKSLLPAATVPTLAPNFFQVGRVMTIEGQIGLSNIVTTPGTISLQVMVGAVIAFTTGAIQMSTTAHTLLPLWFRLMLTVRAVGSGTSANLMGGGFLIGQGVVLTSGADVVSNAGVVNVPLTAPAVGTGFDSTIANTLDFFGAFSISNAANTQQIQQYKVTYE